VADDEVDLVVSTARLEKWRIRVGSSLDKGCVAFVFMVTGQIILGSENKSHTVFSS
jgi:hypothetical protein